MQVYTLSKTTRSETCQKQNQSVKLRIFQRSSVLHVNKDAVMHSSHFFGYKSISGEKIALLKYAELKNATQKLIVKMAGLIPLIIQLRYRALIVCKLL